MARVSVPQQDGEVRVSVNGDPPVVFNVVDGVVEVPDTDKAVLLSHVIPEAEVVEVDAPPSAEVPGAGATAAMAVFGAMTAAALTDHLAAHPEDAGRVLAAETARAEGPRVTVLRAVDRLTTAAPDTGTTAGATGTATTPGV